MFQIKTRENQKILNSFYSTYILSFIVKSPQIPRVFRCAKSHEAHEIRHGLPGRRHDPLAPDALRVEQRQHLVVLRPGRDVCGSPTGGDGDIGVQLKVGQQKIHDGCLYRRTEALEGSAVNKLA